MGPKRSGSRRRVVDGSHEMVTVAMFESASRRSPCTGTVHAREVRVRGIGEGSVRVERQRSIRRAADVDRGEAVVIGVGVVGQDSRGRRHYERLVLIHGVAVVVCHRSLILRRDRGRISVVGRVRVELIGLSRRRVRRRSRRVDPLTDHQRRRSTRGERSNRPNAAYVVVAALARGRRRECQPVRQPVGHRHVGRRVRPVIAQRDRERHDVIHVRGRIVDRLREREVGALCVEEVVVLDLLPGHRVPVGAGGVSGAPFASGTFGRCISSSAWPPRARSTSPAAGWRSGRSQAAADRPGARRGDVVRLFLAGLDMPWLSFHEGGVTVLLEHAVVVVIDEDRPAAEALVAAIDKPVDVLLIPLLARAPDPDKSVGRAVDDDARFLEQPSETRFLCQRYRARVGDPDRPLSRTQRDAGAPMGEHRTPSPRGASPQAQSSRDLSPVINVTCVGLSPAVSPQRRRS